jgi:hypothetical protein
MPFNPRLLFSIGLFVAGVGPFCFAGGMEGGGGRAVVCRNSKGAIRSAELLDLFEGRVQFGWNAKIDHRDVKTQLKAAVKRLAEGRDGGRSIDSDYARSLQKWSDESFAKFKFVDAELKPVDDSGEVVAPRGCKTEQVANNLGYTILMDDEIWPKFDNTSKAALILHEALYTELRRGGEKNSIRTRRLISLTFSGHRFPSIRATMPKRYVVCYNSVFRKDEPFTSNGTFFMWQEPNDLNSIKIQVAQPFGYYQFEAKTNILGAKVPDPNDIFWMRTHLDGYGLGYKLNDNVDQDDKYLVLRWLPTNNGRYKMWAKVVGPGDSSIDTFPEPDPQYRVFCNPSSTDGISSEDWDSKFFIERQH